MLLRLALALATLAAAVAASSSSAATTNTRLIGTVGPGFDISLKHSSGGAVTQLRRGTYTLIVRDRSNIHNFHLTGPGVHRVVTSVRFVGTKTIKVTLKPGVYRYVCDPHAFVMHGSFRVS
jgi:plastocyanin